jgi:hypothetical protein
MSEQSGGPGWWQASDGKWYPPPAPTAPTAEQPAATQPVDPATGQPVYGAPAAGAAAGGAAAGGAYGAPAAAAAGGGPGKIIAIVVVLALLAGGGAYLLTKGGGGGGGTASFCDNAKKFKDDADLNNAFSDPKRIDKALAAIDVLTRSAPTEIKDDMNTLNDAIKKIASALKSVNGDPNKALGAILAASASLDQNKIEQAGKHVDQFAKDKCGVDFSSASDTSSSSSFSFDTSFNSTSFESSLSSLASEFSTFDSNSFSSQLSSACSQFGSDFCTDFSS